MSILHLRHPRFNYSACEAFTKNRKRIQKFKQARYSRYFYQHKLWKSWIQNDMAYEDFKDLSIGTASNKVLRDIVSNIAKISKYNGFKCYNGF